MRRSLIAAAAAASLLFSAFPGTILAKPLSTVPGVFDQGVAAGFSDGVLYYDTTSTHLSQGITPSHTGLLTYIELNCQGDGTSPITLKVGAGTAVGTCPIEGVYQRFIFAPAPEVISGTRFTLSIDTGGASTQLAYTTDPYSGGAAADNGNPIVIESETPVTVASFSFMTFVETPPTTTYTWNPTSVVAGKSTTATLTAVTTFPIQYAIPDVKRGVKPNGFSGMFPFTLKLAALPAWFTPTGIQCDAAISNCSIPNFSAGLNGTIDGTTTGTVTVTITGTAAPASNATGSSGQTSGQGCTTWSVGEDTVAACGTGQSVLGIAGQPTPPPTTTVSGSSVGSGPSPWLLLWTLTALVAAGAVLMRRREARDQA